MLFMSSYCLCKHVNTVDMKTNVLDYGSVTVNENVSDACQVSRISTLIHTPLNTSDIPDSLYPSHTVTSVPFPILPKIAALNTTSQGTLKSDTIAMNFIDFLIDLCHPPKSKQSLTAKVARY